MDISKRITDAPESEYVYKIPRTKQTDEPIKLGVTAEYIFGVMK
jgi:hypothetical protein